ncbi:glycoside hydrolase family 3 domain protein [Paludibacter propionicigenes WB4]|uniref:beta-glucosidase n=1 Tax=Paludibacter propionicigenes (strain DSM 17365 / JCM 13257 / WB4) TaxID=694427 RepID=E4T124_PALPW|nr:beta-glucosidase BglX [Paludibacter propionicigenes]ADQ78405.1 glycoside hydrolase family 3 domain protein [Paludibacter propionicigenes WB4]
MKKHVLLLLFTLICLTTLGQSKSNPAAQADLLIRQMTLDEKIGQLNQYTSDRNATGKITADGDKANQIRQGKVGSMLNVIGVEETRKLQELALQSRLKIPMIFGLDVIHGFRTTFPIPLGETATWDLELMEKTAHAAATEAAAYGIHWTFAPMVDISRDPRWGRVMEGAGEDTYLGCLVAKARVNGFQGNGLGNIDAIMACAKHFAAYGAGVGGRDYNSVDMSLRQLNETYLPPFKAAAEANVATFMNSFNDINGIPATANKYIQRDKLKKEWNYKGFVVSDWGSIGEMVAHGYAKNSYDAAMKAIIAGSDMDMESRCYKDNLKQLVLDKKIDIKLIDEAVKRILIKKFELGLFEDPFRFCNQERENKQTNNLANRELAREAGKKSIVLLKNDNLSTGKPLLPLSKQIKKVALIGPLFKATTANHGFWSVAFPDDSSRIISQYQGIKNKLDKSSEILYSHGCNINDNDKSGFEEAVATAKSADVVILSLGEAANMSGEAKSRSNLHLPGVQEELLKEIHKTGKPIVLLINAGRPLIFNWAGDNIPSILYTWWLGTEAGNSIADVLFGDYNPAAKLPMSFPRTEGQIPVYYNHYSTGRPAKDENDKNYVSAYIDLQNSPRYPFGYGLSYTKFDIDNLKLSSTELSNQKNKLTVTVDLTNSGNYDGEEVVQLYIRDLFGCVVRPVKELKGFQKVMLKKGETRQITFTLTPEDLKFFNNEIEYINEAGDYELFVGSSSDASLKANFKLIL